MNGKRENPVRSLPVANYRSAIAGAVEWLGDRYLLAKPMNSVQSRFAADRAESAYGRETRSGLRAAEPQVRPFGHGGGQSDNVRQQPPFEGSLFGGIGAQPKSKFP
jgi:hypothetical protein